MPLCHMLSGCVEGEGGLWGLSRLTREASLGPLGGVAFWEGSCDGDQGPDRCELFSFSADVGPRKRPEDPAAVPVGCARLGSYRADLCRAGSHVKR